MGNSIKLDDIAKHLHFTHENTKKLLDIFYTSSKTLLDNIQEAIQTNDYETIHRNAHSLKGSSSNLLFSHVSEVAKKIEDAASKKEKYPYKDDVTKIETLLKNTEIV